MNLSKGTVFIIIAIIFLISIFIIFNFRSNFFSLLKNNEGEKEDEEIAKDEGSKANQEFADATLNLYNNDKTVKLKLNADKIEQYNNGLLNINPVEIKSFNINEKGIEVSSQPLYILKGERGEYISRENLLSISGSVTIEKDNSIFSFEKINIKEKDNEIKGKGNVSLETEDFVVKSEEFKTDFSLSTLEFYGDDKNRAKLKWKEFENEK